MNNRIKKGQKTSLLDSRYKKKKKFKKRRQYPIWLIEFGWICVLLLCTWGLVNGIIFWKIWWSFNVIYFNLAFI